MFHVKTFLLVSPLAARGQASPMAVQLLLMLVAFAGQAEVPTPNTVEAWKRRALSAEINHAMACTAVWSAVDELNKMSGEISKARVDDLKAAVYAQRAVRAAASPEAAASYSREAAHYEAMADRFDKLWVAQEAAIAKQEELGRGPCPNPSAGR